VKTTGRYIVDNRDVRWFRFWQSDWQRRRHDALNTPWRFDCASFVLGVAAILVVVMAVVP